MATIANGSTQLVGIIGDPIKQVRAPEVWSALFHHNGINALCIPFHVKPADLAAFLTGTRTAANMNAMILTIPHKQAVMKYVDELTERARNVGAVNVMRREADGRWVGDIFDGHGFVKALRSNGQTIKGRRVLMAGAGGVGTAIGFALAGEAPECIALFDVATERAEALAKRIETKTGVKSFVAPAKAEGYGLVVNASPMGMRESDPIPVDLSGLDPKAIVGDVVVHPIITPFLAAAKARGCYVQPGTHMMEHQIAATAEFLGYASGDWSPQIINKVVPAA